MWAMFSHYVTDRLTDSSDVDSFGVVLLEVTIGEPPIIPGNGHIIQRVMQMVTAENSKLKLTSMTIFKLVSFAGQPNAEKVLVYKAAAHGRAEARAEEDEDSCA
uniref:Serine-threonine/tyrosine-protein kinase catalytic domain-containing protein n=1 Tax=Oryza barthii TaxID=65489 RepID=A0A0D3H5R2_9ORYZ